jgi:hypothetical protein
MNDATATLPQAQSTLIAHKGCRIVPREVIERVAVPAPTATWFPIGHDAVLTGIETAMKDAGFQIARAAYAISPTGGKFFGTLDLTSGMADGVTLAVGVRNSIDKSLPLGFCAGSRVFVCDNLSFSSELVVRKKHTRFGGDRFREEIAAAVGSLVQFQAVETRRIQVLKAAELGDRAAESLVLRSWEKGILSHLTMPLVLKEWREPTYQEFQPRTAWSLFNAYTTVLGKVGTKDPKRYADITMSLTGLIGVEAEVDLAHGTAHPALAA